MMQKKQITRVKMVQISDLLKISDSSLARNKVKLHQTIK
jgi:hypothetical protein